MSEVTITLGRTGQVVKRKRSDSDVVRRDSIKSGSVRDRLGRRVGENRSSSDSKRLRGNDSRKTLNKDGIKDARLGAKDLRLKLLRKRSTGPSRSHDDGANRRKRSGVQDHVPTPPPRSSIHSNMPSSGPESRRNGNAMQCSDRDRGRDSHYRDSPGNYYPSLPPGGSRVRSPERNLRSSRRSRSFSPPVPQADFRGVSSMRPSVTPAPQHVLRNGVHGVHDPHNHRPLQPPPMISPPAVVCRPAAPLPPPNVAYQRSLYWGEASISVPFLLHSLGLEKYVIQFQAEEIDMSVLKQMSEKDLKDMLIPMGPRKKILQAVMAISKRPPAPPPMLPPRPL